MRNIEMERKGTVQEGKIKMKDMEQTQQERQQRGEGKRQKKI